MLISRFARPAGDHIRQILQLIEHGPMRRRDWVEGGPVVFEGAAYPPEPVTAPFTGEQVLGYRVVLEERGVPREGESFSSRDVFLDATEINPFSVGTSGGPVLVYPERSILAGPSMQVEDEHVYDLLTPPLLELIGRAGLNGTMASARRLWLTLCTVPLDKEVLMVGAAGRGDRMMPGTGGYRTPPSLESAIRDLPEVGLFISGYHRADLPAFLRTKEGKVLMPRHGKTPKEGDVPYF